MFFLRYNIGMSNSWHLKLITIFLSFLLPVISLNANPFWGNVTWATQGSIFYFAADNPKRGSDPAPIIPSAGVSAAWRFWDYLWLEVTEDFYFKNYEYNWELGYAMACNPENRSAFVMGLLTGSQLTGAVPITKNGTMFRIYGGFALDIRIVMVAFGLNHPDDFKGDETDAKKQTEAIRKYFWSEGRFFYPVAGIGMDFPVSDKFLLGFDIRTWFPLYRTWTDKDLPSIDGWRFGIGVRITPRKITARQQAKIQAQIESQTEVQPQTEPVQTQPRTEVPQIEIQPIETPQIRTETENQIEAETQDDQL